MWGHSVLLAAVAGLNILLGLVYTQYGTMTAYEMVRNRRTLGFSHFGAAWIAMAFTCGPHHWAHGLHLATHGGTAGLLDLVAVAVGLPAGAIWFALRVEAFTGGRGDRFIAGTPGALMLLPTLAGVYVTAIVASALAIGGTAPRELGVVAPNLALVLLYSAVGYYLLRTQIANRRPLGGWSLSGLALAIVFPTCAAMHGIYAFYALNGLYGASADMLVIDWVAVPAAIYFLWVVQALHRGSFRDWNGVPSSRPASPAPAGAAS